MSERDSSEISVQDAIRLKHDLNNSIKYGGYNANEIKELERLSEKQRAKLNENISHIKRIWWAFPDWVLAIGFLVAGFSLLYFQSFIARIFCLLAMLYCATQVAYRLGVYFGFAEGFQEGHEEGVHRVLGISPDDSFEISEKATEMEMDEMLIRKLDQGKN
jgi:hypothetical protein